MIKYTHGDATDLSSADGVVLAIPHICNDRGGWGKGFVLAVSKRWPQPEEAYRLLPREGLVLGRIQVVPVGGNIVVVNMIAQSGYRWNGKVPPIRYKALDECLAAFRERADRYAAEGGRIEVHMPRIGCGLAGGRWEEIEPIIEKHLGLFPVTVYDWP